MPNKPGLEARVTKLEEQMEEVLAKPAMRKVTERGVCTLGFEPSEECPDGSLGKYQTGCHGFKCLAKQSEYFRNYRAHKKAEETKAAPVKVTVKKKAAEKKTSAPKATPAKRVRASKAVAETPVKRVGIKRRQRD